MDQRTRLDSHKSDTHKEAGRDFFCSVILEQRSATDELKAISRELRTIVDDILAIKPELSGAYQELLVNQLHSGPENHQGRTVPQTMDLSQLKREAKRNLVKSRDVVYESAQIRLCSKALRAALRGAGRRSKPDGAGHADAHRECLSRREFQVLHLIVSGHSSKEIAAELGISFKTAVTHRASIMSKMDVHEIASVVREAIHRGLV